MNFADALMLVVSLFIFGWTVYSLPVLLVGVKQIRRRTASDRHDGGYMYQWDIPSFSIIVPVKDEERVIGRILDRLLQIDYPPEKYEIMVVDDASKDETSSICRRYERLNPSRIRYFHRDSASGKPSALNYGLEYSKGEIIGVFDADNFPQIDVLTRAAEYFRNRDVVAVQGLLSSVNSEENMLTKLIHYEGIIQYDALLSGRSSLSLFIPLVGSCQFIRREVLEEIGGWRNGTLSEDLELSANLTERGYRVSYAPEIVSLQENPSKFGQLIGQRVRWFRGCMEVAFRYGRLLKRFDRRSLDAEAFFIGPFMMIFVLATYFITLFNLFVPLGFGTYTVILLQLTSLLTLSILLILGVALACATRPRRMGNIKWLPFIYLYWATEVFVAFYALLQIAFRRRRVWTKTSHSGIITNQQALQSSAETNSESEYCTNP